MNHKQKIGYTILGAGIMLIGMLIDNLTSPTVIAQNDDEITCKQLTFVSETGLPLFTLQVEQTKDKDSSLYIRNRAGKRTMELTTTSILGNSVYVYDRDEKAVMMLHGWSDIGGIVNTKSSEGEFSTSMSSLGHGGNVTVYGKDGKGKIIMGFDELGGHVTVSEKDSDFGEAVEIRGQKGGGSVSVYSKDESVHLIGGAVFLNHTGGTTPISTAASMSITEHGGRIDVFNNQGKNRAVMSVNEYGNGAVSTWDKNGYRQ